MLYWLPSPWVKSLTVLVFITILVLSVGIFGATQSRFLPHTHHLSLIKDGTIVAVDTDTLPADTKPSVWKPKPFPGTGPYHRVYSTVPSSASSPGFSYESASVFLQDNTQIQTSDADASTAYLYMGGWGSTGKGGAVDAGFQYSSKFNNWAVFVLRDKGFRRERWAFPMRFAPHQTAFMSFSVPQDNQITITWTAVPEGKSEPEAFEVTLDADKTGGWRPDGKGCVLKRMTTIGQKPEQLDAPYWHQNAIWTDCKIGTNKEDARLWSETSLGGVENYPENSPKVQSLSTSPDNDIATVDLTQ